MCNRKLLGSCIQLHWEYTQRTHTHSAKPTTDQKYHCKSISLTNLAGKIDKKSASKIRIHCVCVFSPYTDCVRSPWTSLQWRTSLWKFANSVYKTKLNCSLHKSKAHTFQYTNWRCEFLLVFKKKKNLIAEAVTFTKTTSF